MARGRTAPTEQWKARRAAERLALQQEAEDLGVRVSFLCTPRSRAPAANSGGRDLRKLDQVGLRLTSDELALFDKVHEHIPLPSFSGWVSYCMLRFLEQSPEEQQAAFQELRVWTPPSPTTALRNARISKSDRLEFEKLIAPVRLSTGVRFMMLREAPRYLAQPSAASRALVAALQAATVVRPADVEVLIPHGAGFIKGTSDPESWLINNPPEESHD